MPDDREAVRRADAALTSYQDRALEERDGDPRTLDLRTLIYALRDMASWARDRSVDLQEAAEAAWGIG